MGPLPEFPLIQLRRIAERVYNEHVGYPQFAHYNYHNPYLREHEVPRSARGSRLRPRGHVPDSGGPVVNGLGPDTEGVGDPLLQVVDVHEVL